MKSVKMFYDRIQTPSKRIYISSKAEEKEEEEKAFLKLEKISLLQISSFKLSLGSAFWIYNIIVMRIIKQLFCLKILTQNGFEIH